MALNQECSSRGDLGDAVLLAKTLKDLGGSVLGGSLISENYENLGGIVTSRCNDAVGNINSPEKFHHLALRFSKICLQRVGKWLLADTMPNFAER